MFRIEREPDRGGATIHGKVLVLRGEQWKVVGILSLTAEEWQLLKEYSLEGSIEVVLSDAEVPSHSA